MSKLEIYVSISLGTQFRNEQFKFTKEHIAKWFRRKSEYFIIAEELGKSGSHHHFQCAMNLNKLIRPNTLKASLVTYLQGLSNIQLDTNQRKNIQVGYNTKPSMYHFAYCTKERNYIIYDQGLELTQDETLEKQFQEYKDIAIIPEEKKNVNKDNQYFLQWIQYCEEKQISEPEKHIKLFYRQIMKTIPFQQLHRYYSDKGLEKTCEITRTILGLPSRYGDCSFNNPIIEKTQKFKNLYNTQDTTLYDQLQQCHSNDQQQQNESHSNVKQQDDQKQPLDEKEQCVKDHETSLKSEIQR